MNDINLYPSHTDWDSIAAWLAESVSSSIPLRYVMNKMDYMNRKDKYYDYKKLAKYKNKLMKFKLEERDYGKRKANHKKRRR